MNAEAILTGIITGVLTGGITGYLAALYATRQFKAQRAFDRQLEWYERTVRVLGTLLRLHSECLAETRDRKIAFEEFEKELRSLQQCAIEGNLYADLTSYEKLNKMLVTYWTARGDFEKILNNAAVYEMLRDTLGDLSNPVRKMLGLKRIAFKPPSE